jgi:hypothetical protein
VPATAKQTTQQTGNLVVSPVSLSFGSVPVGQSASATLSLSNSGSDSLQISQIQIVGQYFTVSGQVTLPIALAPGQIYSLTLEFAPTATGAGSATITLAATGNPTSVSVPLSGTGEVASPGIQLQSASVSFGDLQIGKSATQSIAITSSGTAALTVSGVTVTGSGFTVSGLTFPATLSPAQAATLNIGFDPVSAGAVTGSITLATNASSGSATIALSGTGVTTATYDVTLTWDAPTSSADPAVSYRIYRAANPGIYVLLDSTVNASTSYIDTTVQNGATYSWYVESVDAQGNQSAPSNVFTLTIPN